MPLPLADDIAILIAILQAAIFAIAITLIDIRHISLLLPQDCCFHITLILTLFSPLIRHYAIVLMIAIAFIIDFLSHFHFRRLLSLLPLLIRHWYIIDAIIDYCHYIDFRHWYAIITLPPPADSASRRDYFHRLLPLSFSYCSFRWLLSLLIRLFSFSLFTLISHMILFSLITLIHYFIISYIIIHISFCWLTLRYDAYSALAASCQRFQLYFSCHWSIMPRFSIDIAIIYIMID